jgi:hypothetical protein
VLVVLDSGVQSRGLSLQEVLLSLLISVSDLLQLVVSQSEKLALLLNGKLGEFLNVLSNNGLNDGENGIVGVVHETLGETVDGGVEHFSLDFLGVGTLELSVDFLSSVLDDGLDVLRLVKLFIRLGLLEDAQGSLGNVSLEVEVFISEEQVNALSLDVLEVSVDLPVLELVLGDSDEFSDLELDVLVVEDLEIVDLVCGNSSVPSDEERLEERFSGFKIEVVELHPEDEGDQSGLGDPVEIESGGSESKESRSSPESQSELSGHHEVLIMRRNLLGSNEVVEELSSLNRGEVNGVVVRMEGVTVSLREGLLEGGLVLVLELLNSLFEGLNVLVVFCLEADIAVGDSVLSGGGCEVASHDLRQGTELRSGLDH